MKEHHLQLNLAKTELLVLPATPTLQHDFTIQLGSSIITPSTSVRNLGVIFDDQLTFKEHIAKTARSCRSALHNIRKIRPVLTRGGRKNRFSDASRFSLQQFWIDSEIFWFWACFPPPPARIWHVCALETRRASLHRICAVRHVHIAWQCVRPPSVFYFRYAFIYTVWNAVLLDAWNSRTDRLSRALCVCLSWSSIAAAVKCTCVFE